MKGNLKEFGKEYPEPGASKYRSIIRGPFESKHGATVTDAAIKRLKSYLLLDPLNNNIPEKYWKISLENYIKNNLYIIEREKKRVGTQTAWANEYNSGDFFNREGTTSDYKWQSNVKTDALGVKMIVAKPRTVIDGYKVVGDLKLWERNNYNNTSGSLLYFKLGESGEFCEYMPEYDSYSKGEDETIVNPDTGEEEYFTTNYNSSLYDRNGLLDDITTQLTQLRELRYDLKNFDELLAKNWLYFKLHTLYYNEILIDDVMMDTGLTFRIDQPPTSPENTAPQDLIVFEHWKTRNDEKNAEIEPTKDSLQAKGIKSNKTSSLIPANYVFQHYNLIYEKNGNVHGNRNPRIVSGLDYSFSKKPGQPNEDGGNRGMVTMRAQFECMTPARGSTIYHLDSTQLQPDYEIDTAVSRTLPVICDRRITFYDADHGPVHQVVSDYNKYISKEFPDG